MKRVTNHQLPGESRLRVAMISDHASPLAALGGTDSGGQNVYVAQVARHLARLGHTVDVFTRRDDPDLPETVDLCPGARVVHVTAGPAEHVPKEQLLCYMPCFTDEVQRWHDARPYDLLHANFFMSGLVAADLKARRGVPFAITFHALGKVRRQHQGSADAFPDERFAIEDRLVREADRIISECPQDERDLVSLYHADPDCLTTVPCGFDPDEFWPVEKEKARESLGLDPDAKVILQLGRMVPRKGVDNVIRAVARLRADGQDARLLVVGGESREPDPQRTPELGRLMKIARQEGVADAVTFTGSRGRDELRTYYGAADVFVSTPWYEPFGITPIEAMACGTPVIGARVGGIQYTVADGKTGFLVPPKDPDALAEKLGEVLGNPRLAKRLSAGGVKRAREQFTWEKVTADLAAAFELVVRQAAQPGRHTPEQSYQRAFTGAMDAMRTARDELGPDTLRAARLMSETFARGGKVLVCGNGGSAADAQHFAGELVGRFLKPGRAGLPVVSLTADTAILTAWANDIGFEDVFARQVEAYGQPGDLLLGISTSGRSPNVNRALHTARSRGLQTVGLLGGAGGEAARLCDVPLVVPSGETPRIQEVHILLLHVLCELVENEVLARQPGAAREEPVPAMSVRASPAILADSATD